jgi:hypothetical protein
MSWGRAYEFHGSTILVECMVHLTNLTCHTSPIRCGSCVFMIVTWVINIRVFSVVSEVCSLIFIRVGPLYIISSWLSYFRLEFSYFGCIDGIHIIHWIILIEAFNENFGMISSLPMLVNLQTTFVMFSLCYAQRLQHLDYLLLTLFPFPNILQHYVWFNTHTITTLEKFLDVRFFWWFFRSPSSSSDHFSCFFGQA